MKINHKFYLLFLLILGFNNCSTAKNKDQKPGNLWLGLNYGIGTQQFFPFNSEDYIYDIEFYKVRINYLLKEKRKWNIELNIEPSLYLAEHQLVNIYFVQPRWGYDYMEQREEFTEKRKYREYALNLGLTFRHKTYRNLSTYAMGSVGPMYSNTGSERLKEGFAFSDIFAIGFSYNIKSFLIDLRFSIRHVSNADLQWPNIGHNSSNLEFGFMYQL